MALASRHFRPLAAVGAAAYIFLGLMVLRYMTQDGGSYFGLFNARVTDGPVSASGAGSGSGSGSSYVSGSGSDVKASLNHDQGSGSSSPHSVPDTDLDPALRQLLGVVQPQRTSNTKQLDFRWRNEAKLRDVTACLARGRCPRNKSKIVIMNTFHCHWAEYDGYRGGEGVWCLGMIKALEDAGFTVLSAGDVQWDYLYHLYRQIPDLVHAIISDEGEEGHHGTVFEYLKSPQRPDGIPAWKYFSFAYYPTGSMTMVGSAWVVTAEPDQRGIPRIDVDHDKQVAWVTTGEEDLSIYDQHGDLRFTYLGYPLDPPLESTKVVPWSDRPNRVYLLAKEAHYFSNGDQAVYDLDFWQRAYDDLKDEFPGLEFVAGYIDHRSDEDKALKPVPTIVRNLGVMPPEEFDAEFSKSKVMVGMGSPALSPSPYRALAKAVPFINPHRMNEGSNPDDPRTWGHTQHDQLVRIPEPYVYNIEAFDYDQFVGALRRALSAEPVLPLRFVRMEPATVSRRMEAFATADWRSRAEYILEQRKAGNETQQGDKLRDFEM